MKIYQNHRYYSNWEYLKRESDWVARFGGEEFLICLPGAGLARAAEIAENMRKSIEEKEISCKAETIKITAGFGVCCTKPGHGNSFENIIECVDRKLYNAKNNGRTGLNFKNFKLPDILCIRLSARQIINLHYDLRELLRIDAGGETSCFQKTA